MQWLCRKLGQAVVVMDAIKAYHVGTSKNGGTIFWQVNIEGKAGSGHVISYPPDNHHRIKSINPTWVHSLLGLSDGAKYNWVKYWFGEHLLAQFPGRKVAIVESEKTALVASIYLAQLGFVWLASCGKDGLNNLERWKVLEGREVILYPDLSPPDTKGETPFQYWTKIAAERRDLGFDVVVNHFLETQADEFERAQKWDLADFLLRRDLVDFKGLEHNTGETQNCTTKNLNTIPEIPHHYQIKRLKNRLSGLSFEVLLNGYDYPACWDE